MSRSLQPVRPSGPAERDRISAEALISAPRTHPSTREPLGPQHASARTCRVRHECDCSMSQELHHNVAPGTFKIWLQCPWHASWVPWAPTTHVRSQSPWLCRSPWLYRSPWLQMQLRRRESLLFVHRSVVPQAGGTRASQRPWRTHCMHTPSTLVGVVTHASPARQRPYRAVTRARDQWLSPLNPCFANLALPGSVTSCMWRVSPSLLLSDSNESGITGMEATLRSYILCDWDPLHTYAPAQPTARDTYTWGYQGNIVYAKR